jgi:hypothetical protein
MPASESPDRGMAGLAQAGQARACGAMTDAVTIAAANTQRAENGVKFMRSGFAGFLELSGVIGGDAT